MMMDYFVTGILTFIVLLAALYYDVKKHIIPDWLTISAIIFMLIYRLYSGNVIDYLYSFIFVIVGMTLLILISKSRIGGGDLKLFLFLSLVVGFPMIGWLIFLSSLFAVLYSMIAKKKEVIMAPSILAAYYIIFIFMQYQKQFSIVLA